MASDGTETVTNVVLNTDFDSLVKLVQNRILPKVGLFDGDYGIYENTNIIYNYALSSFSFAFVSPFPNTIYRATLTSDGTATVTEHIIKNVT